MGNFLDEERLVGLRICLAEELYKIPCILGNGSETAVVFSLVVKVVIP